MAWKKYSSVLSQFSCGKWENFTLLPLAMSVKEKIVGLDRNYEGIRSLILTRELLCFVNLPQLSKAAKTEPHSRAFLGFL